MIDQPIDESRVVSSVSTLPSHPPRIQPVDLAPVGTSPNQCSCEQTAHTLAAKGLSITLDVGEHPWMDEGEIHIDSLSAGGQDGDQVGETEEEQCGICIDTITDRKELPCKHAFCRQCIDHCSTKMQAKFKCPSCERARRLPKNKSSSGIYEPFAG